VGRARKRIDLRKGTVLSGVTPDNPAFNEEIFGPVAVVVPFDSDDEAIALANRTEYGLSMGVVTANVGRGLRIGERLRTGLLHINDQTVADDIVNPFGGVGASGNGTSIVRTGKLGRVHAVAMDDHQGRSTALSLVVHAAWIR
jgi:acyl-CoA reductase-like NAD-dependent aldehyde dehydrogenase